MLDVKSIDKPDERRDFPRGHAELLDMPEFPIGRATFEPGWRWSESLKPIVGTESCQFHHKCFVISGRLHLQMEDGSEAEAGPGDVFIATPGHDAWVVGDEPCIVIDVGENTAEYAKPR